MKNSQRLKETKTKIVKDKEGVVFVIQIDKKVKKIQRKASEVLFVKQLLEKKLSDRNVYPENGVIGFTGQIESISYLIGQMIKSYNVDNNFYQNLT
jgi:hypothetical protein